MHDTSRQSQKASQNQNPNRDVVQQEAASKAKGRGEWSQEEEELCIQELAKARESGSLNNMGAHEDKFGPIAKVINTCYHDRFREKYPEWSANARIFPRRGITIDATLSEGY